MLGKFKGFYVPGVKRKERSKQPTEVESPMNYFCLNCEIGDCMSFYQDCFLCLFYPHAREEQAAAFQEWHKAKGKVQYDG